MEDTMIEENIADEQEEIFEGFSAPTQNFFHMPNDWTNITATIDNLAELKVVEYVLRHTWGFQEYGKAKTISIDEFVHGRRRKKDASSDNEQSARMDIGTGLSESSVKLGLKKAINHGYLICTVDDSDEARIKKSYKLNMKQGVGSRRGSDLDGGRDVTARGSRCNPRSKKETLERKSVEEKREIPSHTPTPDPSIREDDTTPISENDPKEFPTSHSQDLEEHKRLGKMSETIKRLAHIHYVPLPALKFLDAWGKSRYGPCSLNTWEVSSAIAIVEQMHGTIEDALLIADYLKDKKKVVKVEAVYNSWHLLPDVKKTKKTTNYQPKRYCDDLPDDVWAS